jgi:hypothetical protein
MSKKVELEAASVRPFSPHDESAFFEWLDKLKCIEKYEGRGPTLCITVNVDAVDEGALRELLSLFRRYGLNMEQLIAFDRPEFVRWFRDRRAYWYSSVFEHA